MSFRMVQSTSIIYPQHRKRNKGAKEEKLVALLSGTFFTKAHLRPYVDQGRESNHASSRRNHAGVGLSVCWRRIGR
jgi:hypothetical protein